MAKVKITIDTGPGGECRDYMMDADVFRRIFRTTKTQLLRLKDAEGSQFPPVDRETLKQVQTIMYDFKLY